MVASSVYLIGEGLAHEPVAGQCPGWTLARQMEHRWLCRLAEGRRPFQVFHPKDMSMSCAPARAGGVASQATVPRVTIQSRAAQQTKNLLGAEQDHHLCSSNCAAATEAVATLCASFKRTG